MGEMQKISLRFRCRFKYEYAALPYFKIKLSIMVFVDGGLHCFKLCKKSQTLRARKIFFCTSRRIFRAELECHVSGRIFFHLGRNRAPRLKSLPCFFRSRYVRAATLLSISQARKWFSSL